MSRREPLLLVYAQDAGGARALAPVVRRLQGRPGWRVRAVTHLFAGEVFREAGIEAADLAGCAGAIPLDGEGASRFLDEASPAALVCTTSENRHDPSNGMLIEAAGRAGLPSFALMDHWKGWGRLHREPGDLSYLPGVLGVIDAPSFRRGTREGVTPDRMAVVGHPHLEILAESGEGDREALRAELGILRGDFAVAFFSQPAVGAPGEGPLVRPLLEGARKRAVNELALRLAQLLERRGRRSRFLIRLHPRERGGGRPDLRPAAEWAEESIPSLGLARAADLVLGLDSMILYEAWACGKPVLSLRFGEFADVPGAFEDDPGLLPCVEGPAGVEAFVEEQLKGRATRAHAGYPLPAGSPEACERAIRGLIEPGGHAARREEAGR
ncbi:MAG: hypothetical protein HYZ11_00265 [Candidatus Tectomicrobia bacterium]|uniref:Uncharacterized protein n=1 Tax=Tectimicrobiota bacterium TaxID=2528274 RepID=A0A932HY70_UNCTE|nr:hypothetical protein [Candidatus Tectomicrobia bacterium]